MFASALFILLLLCRQDAVSSVRLVELRVPTHEREGGSALLGCQYDMEGDMLYSVKWYKDDNEFFRYAPKNDPPVKHFNRPGVFVDESRSSATAVALVNLTRDSAGKYSCEVSGEAPNFTTVTSQKNITMHHCCNPCEEGQFGSFEQDFGYVTVREGAHMFYWLFYTTASVQNYTERPLVVWLQGGPGGSSTGIGNFEILGPLDLSLQERNYTWVNNFNVLFIDNPVGTGYSYVDELRFLTTTNDEIARDFVELMRGFYTRHPEFNGVPLYIYGQSYGGKMAVDMGIRMREAEEAGTIGSNLRGVAMGNAWISPVDATLTWGPLLLAAGLVDDTGYENIQAAARESERLFNEGLYVESTAQWAATQRVVFTSTRSVDFYNILTKMAASPDTTRSALEVSKDMLIRNQPYMSSERQEWNLNNLMNTIVKEALGIPATVTWGSQSDAVFNYLRGDFMKPVTEGIEKLLNETDIILTKYNGNLDLICDTPGQILWVDRLRWPGAQGYRNATRQPIWENDKLEGYYKSYGNFRFFWINVAGHSVPRDNPAGTNAFLRDMTSFG